MRPDTEAELAAIIRTASAPLSAVGGGTRLHPGEGGGQRLDLTALSGVVLYEPAALTLVVRAGTPLAEVAAASGFADQSHLTRLFARTFGTTPHAYLRAHR